MTGSCVYYEWNILRACHLCEAVFCCIRTDRSLFGSLMGRGVEWDEGVFCFAMTELPRKFSSGSGNVYDTENLAKILRKIRKFF
jgi:hypothetical protein